MKRLIFFIPILIVGLKLNAQFSSGFPTVNSNCYGRTWEDYTKTFGQKTVCSPTQLNSPCDADKPVDIKGSAQVEYISTERVVLKPGFKAGNFTGMGNFTAKVEDTKIQASFATSSSVGKYEKLEIAINLPAQIQSLVDLFVNGKDLNNDGDFTDAGDIQRYTQGINPFDPDQISIEASFTPPATSPAPGIPPVQLDDILIYGFYYKEYDRVDLLPPSVGSAHQIFPKESYQEKNVAPWRVRFAPEITGDWEVNISYSVNHPDINSYHCLYGALLEFSCVSSSNPGFVKVDGTGKYLEFSNDDSFFPVGINVMDSKWSNTPEINTKGAVFQKQYQEMIDLADDGVDYIHTNLAAWSHGIEWEYLGNYANRMNWAWEIDQMLDIAKQHNFYLKLNLETAIPFGKLTYQNYDWDSSPYSQVANSPEEYWTSEEGKEYYKRKLRYFVSRYGYSTNLGTIGYIAEINETNKIKISETKTINNYQLNSQIRIDVASWVSEMAEYLKEDLNGRQMFSIGYAGSPEIGILENGIASDPNIDLVTINLYGHGRNNNIDKANTLKKLNQITPKPLLIGEMGGHLKLDSCSATIFNHNVLANVFTGGCGAGMYFWWGLEQRLNRTGIYGLIQDFVQDIDFEGCNFKSRVSPSESEEILDEENFPLELFTLISEDKKKGIAWVHNRSYYWGNLSDENSCIDEHIISNTTVDGELIFYDGFNSDGTFYQNSNGTPIIDTITDDDSKDYPWFYYGKEITFNDLLPLHQYTVEFYTTNSSFLLSPFKTETKFAAVNGNLNVITPDFESNRQDYLVKIYRSNASFRTESDSLLVESDSSRERSDSQPNLQTVHQETQTSENLKQSSSSPSETDLSFKLYPNPNLGLFTLEINAPANEATEVSILNYTGQIVKKINIIGSDIVHSSISEFSSGVYLVLIKSSLEVNTIKMVYEKD